MNEITIIGVDLGKAAEQHSCSMVFKTRDLLVRQRNASIKALRGHLMGYEIVASAGRLNVEKWVANIESPDHGPPPLGSRSILDWGQAGAWPNLQNGATRYSLAFDSGDMGRVRWALKNAAPKRAKPDRGCEPKEPADSNGTRWANCPFFCPWRVKAAN